jgi:site-specific recombinase XerD
MQRDEPKAMLSSSALRQQTIRVGERAGVALRVHPHLLRHAYGDAVARYAGLRIAQAVLGHESVETTAGTLIRRFPPV